ncbi:MAG: hypothetical protein Q4G69_06545 [Planctomycetia bacterium]|nr:hypothetical protein [Planctomycetia bacterium]
MNIWNKVLLILILITGTVYLWLGSQRFLLQKGWEAKIAKAEAQYSDIEKTIAALQSEIYGNRLEKPDQWEKMPLAAKKDKIHSLLQGQIWCNCAPSNIVNKSGVINTGFALPADYIVSPNQQNTLVYLFDSGAPVQVVKDGGNAAAPAIVPFPATFLGIFRIASVNRSEVGLISAVHLSEAEIARLDKSIKSKNGWIVCSNRLPIDSPDDIAIWKDSSPGFITTLSEEEKDYFSRQSYLPQEIAGLPADEILSKAGKKRLPQDYDYLMEKEYTQRDNTTTLISRKEVALHDIQVVLADQFVVMGTEPTAEVKPFVDQALYTKAKAANKIETWSDKQTRFKADLAAMTDQMNIVKGKYEQVLDTVKKLQDQIDQLLKENCALAGQIAKAQFEAAKRITKASNSQASISLEDSAQILQNVNL